jgi:hypothetical protein
MATLDEHEYRSRRTRRCLACGVGAMPALVPLTLRNWRKLCRPRTVADLRGCGVDADYGGCHSDLGVLRD